VAGDDFVPAPRVRKPAAETVAETAAVIAPKAQVDGYAGTATLRQDRYGYRVAAGGAARVVMKKLPAPIETGKATFSWTMKPVNKGGKKNGFLVLGADANATAAVVAGAWTGSNQLTIFENTATWGGGLNKHCKAGAEQKCRLVLDMDARTARLTVYGVELRLSFSESVTSVGYVGFGVHHAETLFSQPEMVVE
jgi:hypothetical protein